MGNSFFQFLQVDLLTSCMQRPEPSWKSLQNIAPSSSPFNSVHEHYNGTILRRIFILRLSKGLPLFTGIHMKPVMYLFVKLKNTLDRSVQLVEP